MNHVRTKTSDLNHTIPPVCSTG